MAKRSVEEMLGEMAREVAVLWAAFGPLDALLRPEPAGVTWYLLVGVIFFVLATLGIVLERRRQR